MKLDVVSFFIFRHGETDWNLNHRFQGFSDIPLNETGRTQARGLAPKISRLQPQVLLSSDLSRAHETGKIAVSGLEVDVHLFEELRECDLGSAEGMHRDEVMTQFGDLWTQWISVEKDHLDMCFPRGETKRQHLERLHTCLTGFAQQNTHYNRIAVSTHGGSLWRLLHASEGMPAQDTFVPNCALFHLDYDRANDRWLFCGSVDE